MGKYIYKAEYRDQNPQSRISIRAAGGVNKLAILDLHSGRKHSVFER